MTASTSRSKQTVVTPVPVVGQKHPYALVGFLTIAGMLIVLALAVIGVTGPGFFSFTLGAAFFGLGLSVLVITAACLYLFFSLRTTSRVLAKFVDDMQAARERTQDGRLVSLEASRSGAATGSAAMLAEVARLESRIASLEKPRAPVEGAAVLVKLAPAKQAAERASVFGDVHAVVDVEGIGPVYGDLLNAMGIYNTRQLWEADAEQVAAAILVPLATVDKWQQMAELIAVKGIGPQYAELLVRAQIASIAQLRAANAEELTGRVAKSEAGASVRIQGNTIGVASVATWIRAARDHEPVPTSRAFSGAGPVA
ncbi:MAG TPA: DUF4332 domain-containing protein [Candidatus Thermoplasmatota archaeon]|nr:DUF4332 domain-containing protein [Candidatus Thermoplasmatota archaeon]